MSAAVSQQQRGRTRSNQQALQLHAQATAQQQAQASQQQQQSTHISGRETDTTDVASLMSEDLPDGQAILVPTRLRNVIQLQAQPVVRLIKVRPLPQAFSHATLYACFCNLFIWFYSMSARFLLRRPNRRLECSMSNGNFKWLLYNFLILATFSDNINSLRVN